MLRVQKYEYSSDTEKLHRYSGKIKRYMSLAGRVAQQSCNDIRHGAVLVSGNSVVNVSANKNSFCSFGSRFRKESIQPGCATVHAELGAILGIDRSKTHNADIYVARIDKQGDYKMSKPCPMCEAALRHVGIRRVIFTINNKKAGSYRL